MTCASNNLILYDLCFLIKDEGVLTGELVRHTCFFMQIHANGHIRDGIYHVQMICWYLFKSCASENLIQITEAAVTEFWAAWC